MNVELGLFRQLLKWLWEKNESVIRRLSEDTNKNKASEIYSRIITTSPKIENDRALEVMLPNKERLVVDFEDVGRFLYLEPIPKGDVALPVLSWECDFSRKPIPEIRLHLGLFLLDKEKNLQVIGYRFETPEGEGRHNYYHAQLIKNFHNGGSCWCAKCRDWLPETQPAFVLDARNPVTLLVCILISVYGLNYVSQNLETANFWNELKPYVENMALKNLPVAVKNGSDRGQKKFSKQIRHKKK